MRIVRLVTKNSFEPCGMCKDSKRGKRWEYKSDSLIPSYIPKILFVCEKCIYRENYGSKFYRKAMKQKVFEKLNYNFGDETPRLEK